MTHPTDTRLTLTPGRIAQVTITASATRNAMAHAMWQAQPDLLHNAAANPACRALILTGAGGCFSAGADISEFEAIYATPESALASNAAIRSALAALRALPLPVIAAIEGPCFGGGVAMALACDHIIAAPDAVFAIPPARLGIAYTPEDTAMLLERISAARAKQLLMSAKRLDAHEALDWGLIDMIDPTPLQAAGAYVDTLSQLSGASIRMAKRTVNALAAVNTDGSIAADLAALFSGPDFREGRAAFLARRPPRFDGPQD